MHVLIADKFDRLGIDELESLGVRVTTNPDLGPDTLPGALSDLDPEVLVVRSTKVNAEAIGAARSLSVIVRAGAGYDTIDVASASARGIFVANCPGKNSIAVAELAWGLILACDRRIAHQTSELREGAWNKKEYSKAKGIFGRTLGVIGTGQIGREVIKRAHAFGMPVVAWSRSLTDGQAAEMGVTRCDRPNDVAKLADIVSLHVAATPETNGMVGPGFCADLRQGAVLINTTRGSLIDEEALLSVIDQKELMVGLDVYANEPGAGDNAFDSKLAKHPRVVGTHHVGASTDQAQAAIAAEAVRIVRVYQETGRVPNCVNKAERPPATNLLVVRHQNKPGVLAHVVGALGKARINIQDMENMIYEGGEAACARIKLASEPTQAVMDEVRGKDEIIGVDLTAVV